MKSNKHIISTCSYWVCAHFQPPKASQDPSGTPYWFWRCESGQGEARWFESCPWRSSGGARDLLWAKAETVKRPVLSDFDSLSACHTPLGLCSASNDSRLYSLPARPCDNHSVPDALHIEGGKVLRWLLQVFLWSATNGGGECTFMQIRTYYFK